MRLPLVLVLAPALALCACVVCAPQRPGGARDDSRVTTSGVEDAAETLQNVIGDKKVKLHCEFFPKMEFHPRHHIPTGTLAVYACKGGEDIIWLASEDLRPPHSDGWEWVGKADIQVPLQDIIFTREMDDIGSFRANETSLHRVVRGQLAMADVRVNGIMWLTYF